MAVKEKSAEIIVQGGFSPKLFYETQRPNLFNDLNTKRLKVLVSYISHLHLEGEISDEAFKSIVSHAYSTYIEGKVNLEIKIIESKLQEMLEKYFFE
ncbi:MAG: hypothetical protein JOZ78_23030 [Chroococcidiopsidaceae cyanobacterium CP_BM_ER_R8_30]|nr:hypothetical protein [Chroococcidiopsidaceae cyanobacterium CP_BM_ER_R8_30]